MINEMHDYGMLMTPNLFTTRHLLRGFSMQLMRNAAVVICGGLFLPACSSDPRQGIGSGQSPGGAASQVDHQQAAVLVISVAKIIGETTAAIAPIKDLSGVIDGSLSASSCPEIRPVMSSDSWTIDAEFGSTCVPQAYAPTQFSGRVQGNIFPASRAFDLALPNVAVGSDSIIGVASGAFNSSGTSTSFDVSLNVKLDANGALYGHLKADVGSDGRVQKIVSADLTVAAQTKPDVSISFSNLDLSADIHNTFVPVAGNGEIKSTADGMPVTSFQFVERSGLDGTLIWGSSTP